MENVTHSSKRTASAGGYNGVRSKAVYDDVFGGPPRFGATLSPRVEDYAEIFGGPHASSSRASSIPVLDLPSASSCCDARAPSTPFEYADVFGGLDEPDFAVSFDALLAMMAGPADGRGCLSSSEDDFEEDDARTMSEGEYLSEGSNAKNRRLSDEDSCDSADGSTEFSISYHKAGRSADLSNGITHVAQIHAVPEYSCVVDRSSSFSNTDDDYLPYKVTNGHLNADFSGEIVGGRVLRKTMSQPANGDGNGSMFVDDVRPYKGYVRNGSFPNESFVTISDVSLRTQPSSVPPPRRPPPALDVQKIDLDKLQAERGGLDCEGVDEDGSLPYFDVALDASSSAAASAAAMKEAMEKAQAKLKNAKELMEKRKGGQQTHNKSISVKGCKDREENVAQVLDGSGRTRDDRLQSTSTGQEFRAELPVSQEKQKMRLVPQLTPDSVDSGSYPTLTKKYPEEKHGSEFLSAQGSAEIDGAGEWKEATQYYELVKKEKSRRPFNQANNANILGQSVSDNKLEKKGKLGMDGLEQIDSSMGLTRTKSKCEGNRARSEAGKLHQGLEKVLPAGEDFKWEVNDKKLVVERQSADNDTQDADESAEKFEINGWFQQQKSQTEIKKTVMQKGGGVDPEKAVSAQSKQNENEIKLAHEQAERERWLMQAIEQNEKERRIMKKYEQEMNDKKQKQASAKEEKENRPKETLEIQGSKRREKEVAEMEAHNRKLKEIREKEENERKQQVAIGKEETEKRERAAQESEEKEKRLKETIGKERERRQQEMIEREEIEKKQRVAREREKLEKKLKETHEGEKDDRRIEEVAARKRNEKKQKEYEGEVKEKRMRETLEQEEYERSQKVNHDREKLEKTCKEATEKEEVKERVKQDILAKEIGSSVEGGFEKEENGRILKAAKDASVDVVQKETSEQEDTVNKIHDMHKSEFTNASEVVELNERIQVEPNSNASPLASMSNGSNAIRESQLPEKRNSVTGEVETRVANDRNVGVQTELRDSEKGATVGRLQELSNAKSMDVFWSIIGGGGSPLLSQDSPAEILKKAGEVGDTTEKLKVEKTRRASAFETDVENMVTIAACEINERAKNIEHAQVTSSVEDIKDKSVLAIVVKDEESDEFGRKNAVPQLTKVEVKESVQRAALNAVTEQIVERKLKKFHATMSLEQTESERMKREKEMEQERLRKMEEERVKREKELEQERLRKLEEERVKREKELDQERLRRLEDERVKREKELEQERLRRLEEERVKRGRELEQERLRKLEEERVKRGWELEQERLRKLEEEREREREREKDRMAVDRSTLEGRMNTESRERAERAAVERIMNEARERLEKACAEAREKSLSEKTPAEARLRAERAAVERAAAEARDRAYQKAMAERAAFDMRDRAECSLSDGSCYMERSGVEGESPQRCKARLERHRRTAERAAKALAEKNMRDLLAQREQAERNRLAETLDADVKRWSSGKEGNLRALLSTLQYILGPDSGWQPIPLTEVITAAAVKRAYRKATLCVHPDKLQQRGASIQQKYICEKVFDLLKEAWNRFNSEER